MPHYETIIVLRQDLSATQAEKIAENTKNALLKEKAEISRSENWGLKTLSYPIKKNKKGHYFLINHSNSPQITQEMERVLRLNEDLLRLLTIRTENPEKKPSPMLARSQSEHYNQAQERHNETQSNNENYITKNKAEYSTREIESNELDITETQSQDDNEQDDNEINAETENSNGEKA